MSEPTYEKGIVVGNTYDKYGSRNPIARVLMKGFLRSFDRLVAAADAETVLEVGCGSGELSMRLARQGYRVTGTDISEGMVRLAGERAGHGPDSPRFFVSDLFDLDPRQGQYDLVVCCEVLEHLEDPGRAVDHLKTLTRSTLLFSVPREPVWRCLNVARGKYWRQFGNTPGHLQHWSRRGFRSFLESRVILVAEDSPFPWTMLLASAHDRGIPG